MKGDLDLFRSMERLWKRATYRWSKASFTVSDGPIFLTSIIVGVKTVAGGYVVLRNGKDSSAEEIISIGFDYYSEQPIKFDPPFLFPNGCYMSFSGSITSLLVGYYDARPERG